MSPLLCFPHPPSPPDPPVHSLSTSSWGPRLRSSPSARSYTCRSICPQSLLVTHSGFIAILRPSWCHIKQSSTQTHLVLNELYLSKFLLTHTLGRHLAFTQPINTTLIFAPFEYRGRYPGAVGLSKLTREGHHLKAIHPLVSIICSYNPTSSR